MVRQGSAKPSSTSSNLVVTSKRFPEASASGIFCFALSPAGEWDDLKCAPLSGCGTQHPHRALYGTRVLLAAAPTTPPCFRHWRRSSSLHSAHIQRKEYFYFAFGATAFAERSVAMKAPVGLLSGRAVCVSRWRGFAPTNSAERSKRYFHRRAAMIKVRSELQMPFSSTTPPVKRGFRKARVCAAMKAPVGLLSGRAVCVSR